ncbi:MAG: HEAT repeat domain-containing protein, partial [Phycisphaerae bacterium]
ISLRILRAAADDPDPRVQANAIEVLDKLDEPTRVAVTDRKLASTNSRVRANAIKSLLRTDAYKAGEALLDMLTDESQASRCSALWVVQRLQLVSMVQRIEHMALHDPSERVRRRAGRVLDVCAAGTRPPSDLMPRARDPLPGGSV